MKIKLPDYIEYIIREIEKNGFSAYAVGGCVRDSMRGATPSDWDVATSALPDDVKGIFRYTIDTGLAHGTVTVIVDGESAEVTTFRIEGGYSDSRRPDSVAFVSNIREDLARRDFTINAMAYNYKDGLIDPYGGKDDLQGEIIRTVGCASERFSEDALRILRAVRFSATLGFEIEQKTIEACKNLSYKLCNISGERIFAELNKTFKYAQPYHYNILHETGIFSAVLPEYSGVVPRTLKCDSDAVRWAAVCGDEVNAALTRLRASRIMRKKAEELLKYKDKIDNIKKCASSLKYATFDEVCAFCNDEKALLEYYEMQRRGEPIFLKDLNIPTAEIMNMGFLGKDIAMAKEMLLSFVWEHPDDNNQKTLSELLQKYKR